MQIYDVLKQDHDGFKLLLAELVDAVDGTSDECKVVINRIKEELIPHSRAEEAVFYNALREVQAARKMAFSGYKEHAEAETLLHGLGALNVLHLDWKAAVLKFKETLEHHIQEEEEDIFPQAKMLFIDEEAEMMGQAFGRLKGILKKQTELQNIAELMVNLMPSHMRGIHHGVDTAGPTSGP